MMRRKYVLLLLASLGSTIACGNLGDDTARPPLVVLDGQLTQASTSPAPASNVRVAIIWQTTTSEFKTTHDVPVTPVFPSQFRLELRDPPPASAMLRGPGSADDAVDPTQDNNSGLGQRSHPLNQPTTGNSFAIGTIVAYEDLNGNGRLDLISADAPALDRILGANDALAVIYVEGSAPADPLGTPGAIMPGYAPGYNLLRSPSCRRQPATGNVPTPTTCELPTWLPLTTLYDLPITADPQLADLMCGSTTSSSESSATKTNTTPGQELPPAPGPNGWPAKDAPGLICQPDGKSYAVVHCTSTSKGLCKGTRQDCTQESYRLPAELPPAEWPCTN
jgi:hypothetical protein